MNIIRLSFFKSDVMLVVRYEDSACLTMLKSLVPFLTPLVWRSWVSNPQPPDPKALELPGRGVYKATNKKGNMLNLIKCIPSLYEIMLLKFFLQNIDFTLLNPYIMQ